MRAEKRRHPQDSCERTIFAPAGSGKEVSAQVDRLVASQKQSDLFHHIGQEPIPSRKAVIGLIGRAFELIYPGYFSPIPIDEEELFRYLTRESTELLSVLSMQIAHAIRHDCIRFGRPCIHCEEQGYQIGLGFLSYIPTLQQKLSKDVSTAYEGDPAARHFDEVIFSYPGLYAITVYRIAHWLHTQGVPLIPRIMTEYAHSRTGIDIHPGVVIGDNFFMDHGTGIVIGETTRIGNRVRIYQGVTLGALSLSKEECESLRNQKRHPTIEDDVIIYANATILGGNTIIGAGSVIGGNVWLTESVPPGTEVFLEKPKLVFKNRNNTGKARGSLKRAI